MSRRKWSVLLYNSLLGEAVHYGPWVSRYILTGYTKHTRSWSLFTWTISWGCVCKETLKDGVLSPIKEQVCFCFLNLLNLTLLSHNTTHNMYTHLSWTLWVAPVGHGWHGDTTQINMKLSWLLLLWVTQSFVSYRGLLSASSLVSTISKALHSFWHKLPLKLGG